MAMTARDFPTVAELWERDARRAEARAARAESRVADLEAGIRALAACEFDCITADEDGQHHAVPVEHLRALVGDETPGTGEHA